MASSFTMMPDRLIDSLSEGLDPRAIAVWWYLRRHGGADTVACLPGWKTIGRATGVRPKIVGVLVGELVLYRFLEIGRFIGPDDGSQSFFYRIIDGGGA